MMNSPPPEAEKSSPPEGWRWNWLIAGLIVLLLFNLGTRGLNEPDEGRYANIARAMVRSGDWWEPRMSGFAHYDKPPLVYWTTALAFKSCGYNEWAARLPSVFGAFCALTGLGWGAWRLYGARVAWWAVLLCGTSVQFFILARILTPDMLLTGWCALALGAWAESRTAARRLSSWFWWTVSLAFWTLAWWTKATPALVPLAGLVAGIVMTRDWAGWRALRLWLLLPLILALGSIWYLSMLRRYPELGDFFFGRELAGRMTGHVHGRRGSPIYYLGVSAVAWLPWWPLALWSAWSNRSRVPGARLAWRDWARSLGVEGWIVLVGIVIFSLAASKLPTYTLTLMPWVTLLFARVIVARFVSAENPWPWLPGLTAASFACLALVGVGYVESKETKLGVNSSLRKICRAIDGMDETSRIYCDRYWPGIEFYLNENRVRYVVDSERVRERATDPGRPAGLLLATTDEAWRTPPTDDHWLQPGARVWLLRFRKQASSPFVAWEAQARSTGTILRFDDFSLIPARFENGRIVPDLSPP